MSLSTTLVTVERAVAAAFFVLVFAGTPTFVQVSHLDAYAQSSLAELSWELLVAVATTDVVGASAAYLVGVPLALLAASHRLVRSGTTLATLVAPRVAHALLSASWIAVVILGARSAASDGTLLGDASPIYDAVSADLFLMTAAGLALVEDGGDGAALLVAGPTSVVLRRSVRGAPRPPPLAVVVATAASLAAFVPPLVASVDEDGTVFPSEAARQTESATAQLVYVVASFFAVLPLCASPWTWRGAAVAVAQVLASNFSVCVALVLV